MIAGTIPKPVPRTTKLRFDVLYNINRKRTLKIFEEALISPFIAGR
jgi:hypothetical protein